jgi:hypothetical protein
LKILSEGLEGSTVELWKGRKDKASLGFTSKAS